MCYKCEPIWFMPAINCTTFRAVIVDTNFLSDFHTDRGRGEFPPCRKDFAAFSAFHYPLTPGNRALLSVQWSSSKIISHSIRQNRSMLLPTNINNSLFNVRKTLSLDSTNPNRYPSFPYLIKFNLLLHVNPLRVKEDYFVSKFRLDDNYRDYIILIRLSSYIYAIFTNMIEILVKHSIATT